MIQLNSVKLPHMLLIASQLSEHHQCQLNCIIIVLSLILSTFVSVIAIVLFLDVNYAMSK